MRSIGPDSGADRALLVFAHVGKLARDGGREISLLHNACFELCRGETAGVYGSPRSGKSTLLRLACAIELADAGAVLVGGRDVAQLSRSQRARVLREEVALVAEGAWRPSADETPLGRIVAVLGGLGLTVREARRRGLAALDRLDVAGFAVEPASALSRSQRARVELACAIAREPRLLLVDEPAPTPNVAEREQLCATIREVAAELGMALLVASEDLAALQGLQSLMSISAGELCSTASSTPRLVSLAAKRAAASI